MEELESSWVITTKPRDPEELEKERESQSEDVLLELTSEFLLLRSLKEERPISMDSPTLKDQEDSDPREPTKLENSSVYLDTNRMLTRRMLRKSKSTDSTLLDKLSRESLRLLETNLELKLQRSKDSLLLKDSEEKDLSMTLDLNQLKKQLN